MTDTVPRTVHLSKETDTRVRDLAVKYSLSNDEFTRILIEYALHFRAYNGEHC